MSATASPKRGKDPFFTVPKGALVLMRENIEGTNRAFCVAVYTALRWKANEGVAHDGPVTAAISDIAHRAGCGYRKAADTLNLLESIGVIGITHQTCPGTKERSPSVYTFTPSGGTPFRTTGGTPYARTEGSPVPILERTERTERERKETHSLPVSSWPADLTEAEAQKVAADAGCSADNMAKAYQSFAGSKINYGDQAPASRELVAAAFTAWLKTSKLGKEYRGIDPNSYAALAKRQQDEDRAAAASTVTREPSTESNTFLDESLPAWAAVAPTVGRPFSAAVADPIEAAPPAAMPAAMPAPPKPSGRKPYRPNANTPADASDCPFANEAEEKPRHLTLDALAACGGADPLQVTPSAWSGIVTALADIKAVCADVNPAEIARRAGNYRTHMREAMLSPHALAKNWALCDKPAKTHKPTMR